MLNYYIFIIICQKFKLADKQKQIIFTQKNFASYLILIHGAQDFEDYIKTQTSEIFDELQEKNSTIHKFDKKF